MSKPYVHALSSAKRYGGVVGDYINLHNLLDSSKAAIPSVIHRCLTHNSWFIGFVVEKVFGVTLTNSDGRVVSVRSVAEDHVSEDFRGFIPTVQDYLQELPIAQWMVNGKDYPPSCAKIYNQNKVRVEEILFD